MRGWRGVRESGRLLLRSRQSGRAVGDAAGVGGGVVQRVRRRRLLRRRGLRSRPPPPHPQCRRAVPRCSRLPRRGGTWFGARGREGKGQLAGGAGPSRGVRRAACGCDARRADEGAVHAMGCEHGVARGGAERGVMRVDAYAG